MYILPRAVMVKPKKTEKKKLGYVNDEASGCVEKLKQRLR